MSFQIMFFSIKDNETLFAKYDEKSDCATFASFKRSPSSIQKCQQQFFVLHSSYVYMKRDSATKRLKGEYALNKPLFPDKHLALIKEDVSNFRSEKFVGTYSIARDRVEYFGRGGRRHKIEKLKNKVMSGSIAEGKVELVCFMDYDDH